MNLKTFFMSEDINLILNGNSSFGDFYRQKGIAIPNRETINNIRVQMLTNLKETYGSVEVIPEEDLRGAMQDLASKANYPLISLDNIYLNNNPNVNTYLNLSRIKIGGKTFLSTRSNEGLYLPYEKEIARVSNSIKQEFFKGRPHRSFAYWRCCL